MAAPWVILGRVLRVAAADEEPGDDADATAPAAFSLAVALPPRVAVLAAARSAHPDPARPDKYPYILAAGPGFLLSRFSASPFHGARFGPDPPETHLVVVRPFVTAAGETTASAERVPDRPAAVRNIEGVGLIGAADGDGYVVAELQLERESDRARLFRVYSGHGQWLETELRNPLPVRDRDWVPGGVVSLGGKFWWFDLSWGILSCDAFVARPVLAFISLPLDRVLVTAGGDDVHEHRCITVAT